MIFGYMKSDVTIPKGINLPMDVLMRAKYSSYVKVVENDAAGTITVYFDEGEQVIPFSGDMPCISRRSHATEAFVNMIADLQNDNKIVFGGLTVLGDTMEEARTMYWNIVRHRINAEFLDTPALNTSLFHRLLEIAPLETEPVILKIFESSYIRETALNAVGWHEIDPSRIYSQLDRKEKKNPVKVDRTKHTSVST